MRDCGNLRTTAVLAPLPRYPAVPRGEGDLEGRTIFDRPDPVLYFRCPPTVQCIAGKVERRQCIPTSCFSLLAPDSCPLSPFSRVFRAASSITKPVPEKKCYFGSCPLFCEDFTCHRVWSSRQKQPQRGEVIEPAEEHSGAVHSVTSFAAGSVLCGLRALRLTLWLSFWLRRAIPERQDTFSRKVAVNGPRCFGEKFWQICDIE